MQAVVDSIQKIAGYDINVLLSGETGTGKNMVAGLIHQLSRRAKGPFYVVNCAALVSSLLESELFGHEKGAFTGALSRRAAWFEVSDEGTLLLDEVSEIPLHLQARLLQVIQTHQFQRVGSTEVLSADVRIPAATNQNLADLVRRQRFRVDLYYRLNAYPIAIPSLRERGEDMQPLFNHFFGVYSAQLNLPVPDLTDAAMIACAQYAWPGNVRELETFVLRLLVQCSGSISRQSWRSSPVRPTPARPPCIWQRWKSSILNVCCKRPTA